MVVPSRLLNSLTRPQWGSLLLAGRPKVIHIGRDLHGRRLHLMSTSHLAELIQAKDVKVVDGSWHMPATKRNPFLEYQAQHIPSAVFFDIDKVSDTTTDLPHMLPSIGEFEKAAGQLGIAQDDNVVVYDTVGVNAGCRAWWTFRVFGHKRLWVLDGGLPKWMREGRPLESQAPKIKSTTYMSSFQDKLVKNYQDMLRHISRSSADLEKAQIVDARSEARFLGTAPEPRPGLSSGHMPGSVSVPFDTLVDKDAGTLLPKEKLRAIFESKSLDLSRPIITTCGSGVTASIVFLALHEAGARNVSLYDGSWTEYASKKGSTIVTKERI